MSNHLNHTPSDWHSIPFGEVGPWFSGGTPSRRNPSNWVGDVPWISPKDMKRFRLVDSIERISESAAANGSCLVEPGTLLFVIRGMILLNSFPVGIATRPAAFNQDIKAVVCKEGIDPYFLGYWLTANSE